MSDENRFGELRSLLQRTPSAAVWDHLCLALETWPAEELRDQAIPYVQSIVERWPDALRAAPPRWIKAFALGRKIPWLPLVRGLSFHHHTFTAEGVLKAFDALDGAPITALNLRRAIEYNKTSTRDIFEHPALDHVRTLEMSGIWSELAEAAHSLSSPRLDRVESLTLESLHIGPNNLPADAAVIERAQRLKALQTLKICWLYVDDPKRLAKLRDLFPLAQLHTLELQGCQLDTTKLRALLEDQDLPALRHLKMPDTVIRAAEARELAQHVPLEAIETLTPSFIYNEGDLEIAAALKTLLSRTHALRSLTLTGPLLRDEAAQPLLAAHLPALDALHIKQNRLSAQGLEALLTSPIAAQLTQLSLTHTEHAVDLARAITTAGPLPALHTLDLSSSALGQRGAALLSRATLPGLRSLKLNSCDLDAHSVEALMTAPWMAQLESLELNMSKLDSASFRALMAHADQWRNLKHLNLGSCNIGPGGALALAHKSTFTQLESLNLTGNMFGASALAALLRAPWLTGLKELDIRSNNLDDEAAAQLAGCAALWGLEQLHIGDHNLMSKVGEQALDASPHLNTLAWPRKHTSEPLRSPQATRARQRAELELGPPTVRKRTK